MTRIDIFLCLSLARLASPSISTASFTLPTNHKLSRMVGSSDDNIYRWVYREELGEEGECKRKGCTVESETTEHALCECRWAQEKWQTICPLALRES